MFRNGLLLLSCLFVFMSGTSVIKPIPAVWGLGIVAALALVTEAFERLLIRPSNGGSHVMTVSPTSARLEEG